MPQDNKKQTQEVSQDNKKQTQEIKQIVVGLDVGTTKIVAIAAEKLPEGKVKILGYAHKPSVGIRRGMVENIVKASETVKAVVEECRQNIEKNVKHTVKISSVIVGIAGEHIESTYNQVSLQRQDDENEIQQSDIDKLAEMAHSMVLKAGESILRVIAKDYNIDHSRYNVRDCVGMPGKEITANFHVITGQQAQINHLVRCVELAGLEVEDIVLEPIASAESVLSYDEKEAGTVLVDIGGGTTDIAIMKDHKIEHTAVIPYGGNMVTNDIVGVCKILERYAEKLKQKFGSCISNPTYDKEVISVPMMDGRPPVEIKHSVLVDVIKARMEEIISFVNQEIDISNMRDQLIGGIALTGGGSSLKGVKELFEFHTGLNTRIGAPDKRLVGNYPEDLKSPIYATAIGLLLCENTYGFHYSECLRKAKQTPPAKPVVEQSPITPEPTDTKGGKKKDKEGGKKGGLFQKLIDAVSDPNAGDLK